MTSPQDVAELVRQTGAVGEPEEWAGVLTFKASLDEARLRQAWLELRRDPPSFLESVAVGHENFEGPLEDGKAPRPGELFRITLNKAEAPHELRLFLAGSIARAFGGAALAVDRIRIAELTANGTFETFRSRFEPWSLEPSPDFVPAGGLPDPRLFSLDLTGAEAVPADLRPWLLRIPPARDGEGEAFRLWRAAASRRLLAALANRVTATAGGGQACYFAGPPSCSVSLADEVAAGLFDRLNAAARWVFEEGRDFEARHILLGVEWARSYQAADLARLGEGCLDSARGAFTAYVKSGSRDTLKAVADLRKSVIDETQKISQRAQDLAGAVWKDLAVAAAPFVLKILPDSAKAGPSVSAGLAIAAALFLAFSFYMQVFINRRFFRNQAVARGIWRQALNTVLTAEEVDEYSEKPIKTSLEDYRGVRWRMGVFYGLMIAILVFLACHNLVEPTPPPVLEKAASPG